LKKELILAFILGFNMFLFFTQAATASIAAGEGVGADNYFHYKDSLMGDFEDGNYTLDEDIQNKLPDSQAKVEPDSGNIFTDAFSTIKAWFLKTTGLNILAAWYNAFPNFLKTLQVPIEISFGLGFFWNALIIYLIITLLTGR